MAMYIFGKKVQIPRLAGFLCVLGMSDNLVVKVHYRLGSRNY